MTSTAGNLPGNTTLSVTILPFELRGFLPRRLGERSTTRDDLKHESRTNTKDRTQPASQSRSMSSAPQEKTSSPDSKLPASHGETLSWKGKASASQKAASSLKSKSSALLKEPSSFEDKPSGSKKETFGSKPAESKTTTSTEETDEIDDDYPNHCGDLATFIEGRQVVEWVCLTICPATSFAAACF